MYYVGTLHLYLKHNIQQCVSDIHEWYDQNKLVINKSKSSVMLAPTRQRILHIDNNDFDVHIGDYKLVQSDCIDYLGLKIDETISWNMQTENICKKLVFIISRFSRLKHILPSHMLMLIYSSIIQPKFDYAITIWGYTCDNNLHKIQRLQNRAARIVTGNYDYVTTRGTELVRRLRWMCVTQRRDYFMSILMYKSIRGMAPAYLCNEITLHSEIAERTTRSVNVSVIRPVLEYACPVWHTSLPMYLSDHIETIQKRCLRTIFPGYSYDEARSISNLPTLFEKRTKLCQSYFRKMQNADHKLHKLLTKQRSIPYGLKTYDTLPVPLARTDRFRRSLIPWGLANWQHNVL